MLDPLSAIGVASSDAQLVDFAAKVLEKTDQLRSHGRSANVASIQATTNDLKNLCEDLKRQSTLHGSHNNQTEAPDKALDDLVDQSTAIANELISCLESLTIQGNAGNWESLRAAIRTMWKQKKIDEVVKQLEMYRLEVSFRLLVLLNAKSNSQEAQQTQSLQKLQRGNQDIVEVISINHTTIVQALQETISQSRTSLEKYNTVSQRRHEETMAAIFTLSDGNVEAIARPQRVPRAASYVDVRELDRNSVRFQGSVEAGPEVSKAEPFTSTVSDFESVSKRVLNSLYFHQMSDGIDDVATAHQQTFRWIFCNPESEQLPWSNFVDWLERGSGCYWINGKAGSGKSTLMKYIRMEPKTRQALLKWADKHNLIIASYFSWNLGTTLQKSHIGLLRSLLFEIIDRHVQDDASSLFHEALDDMWTR